MWLPDFLSSFQSPMYLLPSGWKKVWRKPFRWDAFSSRLERVSSFEKCLWKGIRGNIIRVILKCNIMMFLKTSITTGICKSRHRLHHQRPRRLHFRHDTHVYILIVRFTRVRERGCQLFVSCFVSTLTLGVAFKQWSQNSTLSTHLQNGGDKVNQSENKIKYLSIIIT